MSSKVYIVAVAGVETYWIRHVCASEETARNRFEEVRKELLKDNIRMRDFLNKANRSTEIYDKLIKLCTDTTFDNQLSSLHNHPVCDKVNLEE